ncbi:MAG: hypothetical protein CL793_07410 [Chloroflexi bacterium]|nr:hypothetical protein [Chloroflexota bacterium]|tara:strand:- start:10905 stop:11099 length:195 start_codon:yes stop_codon:yes gene_type:complete
MNAENFAPGDMVFWGTRRRPYWVIEFQPDNGNAYWIVDARGEWAVATFDELSTTPSDEEKGVKS